MVSVSGGVNGLLFRTVPKNTVQPRKLSLVLDIDECGSSPCMNGATCAQSIDEYNCTCVEGFVGSNCETGKPLHRQMSFLALESLDSLTTVCNFYHPHPKDGGWFCFQFVSLHLDRGGGTSSQVRRGGGRYHHPRSGWGGYQIVPPSQIRTGGTPIPGQDRGYPQIRWGVPPSQVRTS